MPNFSFFCIMQTERIIDRNIVIDGTRLCAEAVISLRVSTNEFETLPNIYYPNVLTLHPTIKNEEARGKAKLQNLQRSSIDVDDRKKIRRNKKKTDQRSIVVPRNSLAIVRLASRGEERRRHRKNNYDAFAY